MTIQYQPDEEKLILPEMEKEEGPKYKCGCPCYVLDADTKNIIIGLLDKCLELKLGNVSFNYSYSPYSPDGRVSFYLAEYKVHWELVVRCVDKKTSDIYQITTDPLGDHELTYQRSEKD